MKTVTTPNIQRGLESLLRMLMHTNTFASSDIEINTGAPHTFKAKNLFVHFNNISEEHHQKWKGYWGIISHANTDISWLIVADKRDIRIPVSKLKNNLLNMCKIESAEELAGASVLVFGKLETSANGKWVIKIDEDKSRYIFVKVAK